MSPDYERSKEELPTSLHIVTDALLETVRNAPRGLPETYGATPLNHAAAYDQQYTLRIKLQELLEENIPSDVPAEIAAYMIDTFVSRFISRGAANQENYLSSLKSPEELGDNERLQDMITRAELGLASPSELLVVRQLLGIRSVELACLTHPYGKNIEQLEPMRQAVRDNVLLLGGEYYDEPEERYRVKGFVNDENGYTKGLLMTRKRTVGIMPDGTIIRERSSFVLRLDDNSVVSNLTIAAIIKTVNQLDRKSNDWQDELVAAGHLDEICEGLLSSDKFSMAIPVSTTIYAFNPETAQLVKERAAEDREKRKEDINLKRDYPLLFEAQSAALLKRDLGNRAVKDIDGMLYVGLEEPDDDA
ncbi:MAG: hypothetical protein ACOH18_02810 [Candidatus Saccharimonadaceae bacterium]